jgi:hypothetical protein
MVELYCLGPVLQHLHRDRQIGTRGSAQVNKSVNNRHRQLLPLFLPTKGAAGLRQGPSPLFCIPLVVTDVKLGCVGHQADFGAPCHRG